MAKTLTARSVESAKAIAVRQEIPDGGCRGLYLVTQTSGLKSWCCRYRFAGKPTKLTLGAWPALSLAEARRLTATAMAEVARGVDPAAERREAKKTSDSRDTVERLAILFIEQHAK